MAQLTYFVPGVDQEHAGFIFELFKMSSDDTAISMLDAGIVAATEERARDFLSHVDEYDRAKSEVFRFYMDIPEDIPLGILTAAGLTVVE